MLELVHLTGILNYAVELYGMMWYKKAKLIDLDPPVKMNLHCAYCGRWATNADEFAKRDMAIWKKPEDLDAEEKGSMRQALIQGPSSGMCPYCSSVAKEMRDRKLPYSNAVIKSLSLKMN